ncbi:oligomeric Golgi complex component [Niveomyces insectorum RCEF 264]|uniref:Conserved oligomeric Golgi complex subunit 1 n=1 Tax=Niveomyces insectorum RCEF 264 TaxID=1081102 RepID=A0A167PG73_9HYPO|nr:oligomeric Golgi complex component [Niveomyces insectorum RCEF 264]
MAISEPDVGLLTSSAQIFASNHTLPQIRAIHKALHGQIDDKATQVGGSYRELLGTADTIVQMRVDMDAVQATLAGMGGRCGRAVVGTKVAALAALVDHGHEQAALGVAARTRTSRLVLAAKVLVLGRLLVTSLGEWMAGTKAEPQASGGRHATPEHDAAAIRASIEASKQALDRLRRRLRVIVEIVERAVPTGSPSSALSVVREANREARADDHDGSGSEDDDDDDGHGHGHARQKPKSATAAYRDDLLRALCAYSLATTSGAHDVLRQLLHVRSQAMALAFEEEEEEEQAEDDEEKGEGGEEGENHGRRHTSADTTSRVLRGLALYTKTLLDVQTLLPHRLPDALLALKKRPLLDDPALRALEGLRLDVDARWCGDDLRYFAPYLRHDDLDAAEAREMLGRWAAAGGDVLLAGVQAALVRLTGAVTSTETTQLTRQTATTTPSTPTTTTTMHLRMIVALRTRVLRLWLRDSSQARGVDPSVLLGRLRAVFNRQMLQVLDAQAGALRRVGAAVTATLASWQAGVTDRQASLWGRNVDEDDGDDDGEDDDDIDTDLADGVVPFVRDVARRLHGRTDAVARAVAVYTAWRHAVDDAATIVEQLRRQRWDNDGRTGNDLDDNDNDDDVDNGIVEDEETLAARQAQLSRADPETLQVRLQTAVADAFQDLDAQIAGAWAAVVAAAGDHPRSDDDATITGSMAAYLVRVLREIRSRRPAATAAAGTADKEAREDKATAATGNSLARFGLGVVPALHAAIARVVVAPPLDRFATTVLTRRTVAGRLLWDADVDADAEAGGGPAVLKQHAGDELRARWTALFETAADLQDRPETTEDETTADEMNKNDNDGGNDGDNDGGGGAASSAVTAAPLPADQRRDLLLQWLFDLAWLRCSLGTPATQRAGAADDAPTWPLGSLEDAVLQRTGLAAGAGQAHDGSAVRRRIAKTAEDYWKKTSLLFGLLA